jgi:hypothetical protein
MARTTFSGPVKSDNGFEGDVTGGVNASQGYVILYATAAANIADIANAVNTSDKQAGTLVFDTTNSKLKVATGSAAASTWVDADGTNAVTPI